MSIRLSGIVTPGDKIDMWLTRERRAQENGGDTAPVCRSSVCDIVSETELEISMPTKNGRVVMLQDGVRCEFLFYANRGMYGCEGVVKRRCKQDNICLILVEITSNPVKHQRREFFRVSCLTDIKYYEISEETAMLPSVEQLYEKMRDTCFLGEAKRGTLCDISGGGARFSSSVSHEKNCYLLLVMHLANERVDDIFYLVCQVMNDGECIDQGNNIYSNRVKFMYKDLRDREKIVRFVFEEDRRIRRKDSGDWYEKKHFGR